MKIRIRFRKQGAMKFIGHLDTMRYFQKVMRRAGVDIRYSEGFSPHQIMSFAAPLGVGLLSNGEYVDIEVLSTDTSAVMVRRMNEVMAEGFRVMSYRKLEDSAPCAMSLVAAADYILAFREGKGSRDREEFFADFDRFLSRDQIPAEKKTKKGTRVLDLKPLIYEARRVPLPESLACLSGDGNGQGIFLRVSAGSRDNVKPELVMESFCRAAGREYSPLDFQAEREEVYANLGTGEKMEPVPLEDLGEEIE